MLAPTSNPTPTVRLGNNIQDSKFNNNILDTLVPDLMPNLGKLKLLSCEV